MNNKKDDNKIYGYPEPIHIEIDATAEGETLPGFSPIEEKGEQNKNSLAPMLSNSMYSQLSGLQTRKIGFTEDPITKAKMASKGAYQITVFESDKIKKDFTISTSKLLHYTRVLLTQANDHTQVETLIVKGQLKARKIKTTPIKEVTLNVHDFLELQGYSDDRKKVYQVKSKVIEDLALLKNTRWTGIDKEGRQFITELIQAITIDGSNFIITFADKYVEYMLLEPYIMFMDLDLLKLDDDKAAAYKIGYRLMEHFSMNNYKNPNKETTISVKTLLEHVSDVIPSVEKVRKGDRRLTIRILEPFEHALSELEQKVPNLKWHYKKPVTGEPYTELELKNWSFEEFYNANIYVSFDNISAKHIEMKTDKQLKMPIKSKVKYKKNE